MSEQHAQTANTDLAFQLASGLLLFITAGGALRLGDGALFTLELPRTELRQLTLYPHQSEQSRYPRATFPWNVDLATHRGAHFAFLGSDTDLAIVRGLLAGVPEVDMSGRLAAIASLADDAAD
jgi:hypothetical protein